MILEEVPPHPFRDDIYINTVITPHGEVKNSAKLMVRRILLKEIARSKLEVIVQ